MCKDTQRLTSTRDKLDMRRIGWSRSRLSFSSSHYLQTERYRNTRLTVPIFKIYMGKGKSTGRLVQLHWETIKLKDNCGRIACKFQSAALKQASWGINFITQLQCVLWFNKWKTFCFTAYFKDSDHICCTEVWDVSLTFTAWSCMEALFSTPPCFLF